ncbi:MAG TPA: GNAT family N-acetyltransferase [Ktedonobacterales bacterium]
MDIEDIKRRVLAQRMHRYPDAGPDLGGAGTARFRQETGRLRVAFANIRPGREPAAISAAQRFARQRGSEVQWIVVPERPDEERLSTALRAAQFHLDENLLLMAHEGLVVAPRNPAVTISIIETQQAMWQYEYGSRQAFFDEEYPVEAAVTQRARDRWREYEHGWCRYYAAALAGRTVGGCYVSLFEEIPTILGVYTTVAARRHGVATVLLERVIADLVHNGHWTCCLFVKHGNPAELLYRKIGFMPLMDEQTWMWSPWQI